MREDQFPCRDPQCERGHLSGPQGGPGGPCGDLKDNLGGGSQRDFNLGGAGGGPRGDKMDEVDRRVAELFLFDFDQSGIDLPEGKRAEFVRLNERILVLGGWFVRGAQCGVSVPRGELPVHLRDVFGGRVGGARRG